MPADFLKCGCRREQDEVIAVWENHLLARSIQRYLLLLEQLRVSTAQMLTAPWCGGHCCWWLCPECNIPAWLPQLLQGPRVIKHNINHSLLKLQEWIQLLQLRTNNLRCEVKKKKRYIGKCSVNLYVVCKQKMVLFLWGSLHVLQ